jgi:hypothetical protein
MVGSGGGHHSLCVAFVPVAGRLGRILFACWLACFFNAVVIIIGGQGQVVMSASSSSPSIPDDVDDDGDNER